MISQSHESFFNLYLAWTVFQIFLIKSDITEVLEWPKVWHKILNSNRRNCLIKYI